MAFKFFENLKNKSEGERSTAVLAVTVLAALLLVPIWFWHLKSINIKSEPTSETEVPGETLSEVLSRLGNPVEQVDQELKNRLANPVVIISTETVDKALVVKFKVQNNTFADLVFPTSSISLVRTLSSGETEAAVFEKALTTDGGQWLPVVRAGETKEGSLYFSKISNGNYLLTISELQYEGEDQSIFNQVISLDVTDSLKPRT